MPELPEVEALADYLRVHAVGRTVARVDVASLSVLKTAQPPWTQLHGREVSGVTRHGKFLDLDCSGWHLVVHLARAGWLRWSTKLSSAPPKPGSGPLALRCHLGPPGQGPGFDLTEAGTKKGLAVWIVSDPYAVEPISRLGPDAHAVSREELAAVLGKQPGRLKRVLTEQSVLAGLGNAYSDEILHAAKLSPFATANRLGEPALDRLHEAMSSMLDDAVSRSVGQRAATLKQEKRTGMRVHARTGLPCPVCGDSVREVSYADKAFQYCATCQTGGKPLADRRLSRLLK